MRTALYLKEGVKTFLETKKDLIIAGILYIVSVIIYIIGMQIGFNSFIQRTGSDPQNFWGTRIPHFGIIAPFVSGLLDITGLILGTIIIRKKDPISHLFQKN